MTDKTTVCFIELLHKTTVCFIDLFLFISYNMPMKRALLSSLQHWLIAPDRKPLIIRGARQVGKTWLIRHLAAITQKQLIEINLEKQPTDAELFTSNNPQDILLNLSAAKNQSIRPQDSILFLDEIQMAPNLLSKLRWFAEDLPELPVIAAGSLLDFVLAEHSFSMPVGRVSYFYLEPMSFEEFLLAHDKKMLFDYLSSYDLQNNLPLPLHTELMNLFKEYLTVGGLPAAVASWVNYRSLNKVHQIQHDLLATYRDDFSKYKGRIAIERLDEVMMATPRMLGQKFIFSKINPTVQANTFKQVLDLLDKARLCHRVWSSAANGIPLGAEIREKYFKEIFIDVGLCCTSLGLNLSQVNAADEIILINNGAIAEQVVGQLLRTIEPPYIAPSLYYWLREEPGSSAEIDYVIQHNNRVIPIEVKAGKSGTLKSLHLFMGLKNFPLAIRINSDFPSQSAVKVKNHSGKMIEYTLLSLPFYLIGQIHRLL